MRLYVPLDAPCERSRALAERLGAQIITDLDCLSADSPFFAEIKRSFNPLLKTQNYMLFDDDNDMLIREIPYFSIPFEQDNAPYERIVNALNDDGAAKLFECLFNYAVTKALRYMNEALLCKQSVSLTVFPLLDALLSAHFNNEDTAQLEREIIQAVKCSDNASDAPKAVTVTASNKQNLVLIHLESVSNVILNANKHLFPNLNRLAERSIHFTNYFSTATTTVMALCAVFYGNAMEPDSASSYYDVSLNETYNKNIFEQLSENGYKTAPFLYTSRSVTSEISDAKIWNDGTGGFSSYYEYDKFINGFEDFISENKDNKFAVFIDNEVSHCGVTTDEIRQTNTFERKMEEAYKNVDDTIGRVFDCLEKNKLLDNTTIVLYGDHGDDKWTRSMNNGFSHLIAPYMSSVHTPLFVYDRRLSPSLITRLTSAVDLKYIMLYMLGIESRDEFEYSGRNTLLFENDFIYASNLYANQAVVEEIKSNQMAKLNGFSRIERKNKSFGVMDGNYCLIVGSDGMELFNMKSDPLNYNNLLNFFELNEGGSPVTFNNYGAWRGHFRLEIMDDRQVCDCLSHYFVLRKKLVEHIEIRNELVKRKNPKSLNLFDFSCFNKVRPRNFVY